MSNVDGTEFWSVLESLDMEAVQDGVQELIKLFIERVVEARCGRQALDSFVSTFLPEWISTAQVRVDQLSRFPRVSDSTLSARDMDKLARCRERLECALRDAEMELFKRESNAPGKAIGFSKPLAHRIVRRSRDRMSLCSVTDADETMDQSWLSPSPHRRSSEPAIGLCTDMPSRHRVHFCGAPAGEVDHYTGRISGVYYGGLFTAPYSQGDNSRLSSSTVGRVNPGLEVNADSNAPHVCAPLPSQPLAGCCSELSLQRCARRLDTGAPFSLDGCTPTDGKSSHHMSLRYSGPACSRPFSGSDGASPCLGAARAVRAVTGETKCLNVPAQYHFLHQVVHLSDRPSRLRRMRRYWLMLVCVLVLPLLLIALS